MGHVGTLIHGYFVNIDGHRTWGHFKKSWMYMVLIKAGEHVNEMIAVAANFFRILMVRFSY